MKKQREGSEPVTRTVQLSDESAAHLSRDLLRTMAVTKNLVSGWVAAEQQQLPTSPTTRGHKHGGSTFRPLANSGATPKHFTRLARLQSALTGAVLRPSARSPARRAQDSILDNTCTGAAPWSFEPDDAGDRKGALKLDCGSSTSASVVVESDDDGVDSEPGPVEMSAWLDGGGDQLSTQFGSSRPATPSVVEARGGRVPRGYQADLSSRQVYSILVFVVCAFVFVSYPTDPQEELREIQMIFANANPPPLTAAGATTVRGVQPSPQLPHEDHEDPQPPPSAPDETVELFRRQREASHLRRLRRENALISASAERPPTSP